MKSIFVILYLMLAGCDQNNNTGYGQHNSAVYDQNNDIVSPNKYQLTSDSNGNMWKIDTTTGNVEI